MNAARRDDAASSDTPVLLNRVMIIDDDTFDLKMYRRIIDRSGLVGELLTFTSAEDALAHIADPARPMPDLVFLDINMPRMTGFEFMDEACRLLGDDFSIPIIMMLTTSISPDDKERAASFAPIRGYFNKPINADHLRRAFDLLEAEAAAS